jgi:hypothetical protein
MNDWSTTDIICSLLMGMAWGAAASLFVVDKFYVIVSRKHFAKLMSRFDLEDHYG